MLHRQLLARSQRVWRSSIRPSVTVLQCRAFTPISVSPYGREGHLKERDTSSMQVQVTVPNAAAKQGKLMVQLPLPGLPGLTKLQENNDLSTVQHVIETIKQRDPSLKSVEITTLNGTKVARTVQLKELVCMEFVLRLNRVSILIEQDASQGHEGGGDTAGFGSVKAALEKDSRIMMPLEEFHRLCINAGAEEPVAQKWLRELQRRNLVVHFEHSTNNELRNTIILRPNSMESHLLLQNALDSSLDHLKHEKKKHSMRQQELSSELRKMDLVLTEVQKQAHRLPNTYKWLAWTGMTSFYGTLMYLVWDVYSWDIMEPITYFIGFSAVLGNSFYHAVTKKDATYSNIWHKTYRTRVEKLLGDRKLSRAKLEKVQRLMAQLDRDIDTITAFEDTPRVHTG